jgi:predicted amidohydrolase
MRVALGLAAFLAVAWACAAPAAGQALDPASATALSATLRLLQDPAQRDAAIAGNPQAAAADRQIQGMLRTPELRDEFFALAGAIFSEMVQRSGGDVTKMVQALSAGQADPAGFVASLSPQTAERLRAFASKVSDQKP